MSQSRDNVPSVPDGWKAVFDEEYKTWYYVDLKTGQSQWEPPKGAGFSRPAAPPPPPQYEQNDSRGYQRQQPPPPPTQQQPRYQSYPQQPAYYQQPMYPQQQPVYYQQPVYQQQQQQPVYYQQKPTKSKHGGMMSGLVGAGIGLLGGAMLADAIDDHDRPEIIENNYYGDDNGGFGGGFNGGDFMGGGFDGGFDGGW